MNQYLMRTFKLRWIDDETATIEGHITASSQIVTATGDGDNMLLPIAVDQEPVKLTGTKTEIRQAAEDHLRSLAGNGEIISLMGGGLGLDDRGIFEWWRSTVFTRGADPQ